MGIVCRVDREVRELGWGIVGVCARGGRGICPFGVDGGGIVCLWVGWSPRGVDQGMVGW